MGRIKTQQVKRITHELLSANPNRFTKDFDENKKAVDELVEHHSKKLRNVIAGYATRIMTMGGLEALHRTESYSQENIQEIEIPSA